jgi:prophage antirepressor-like protein
MGNQIQVFKNKEFGEIRTVEINDEPWWVLKDVCNVLSLKNVTETSRRLDEDERCSVRLNTLGGNQSMTVISESGLYAVILRSDKPNARAFRKWITSIVIPSIRKNGGYITDELLDKIADREEEIETYFDALVTERRAHKKVCEKNESLQNYIREVTPRLMFCDSILKCENSIPVSVIAKDYGMSAAAFNKLLHELEIQYKVGDTWVLYAKYCNCGFTETKTYRVKNKAVIHTRWTPSGRKILYGVLKRHGILPESERYESL